jgi:ComF family protein
MAPPAVSSLLAPPFCWGCRGPSSRREPLCRRCRATLRPASPGPALVGGVECWAAVAYEGAARELVRGLKFRGAQRLAAAMAARVTATAPEGFLAGTLVPVPLHPARLRRRGFNQAALLAAELGRRGGFEVSDCLERRGSAGTQARRRRGERIARPAEIRVRGAPPERVLLVDDVVTTGATLAACADALRKGGACGVRAVAFAKTLAR